MALLDRTGGKSIRDSLLTVFRPRTSPPSAASVLRSVLWPLAVLIIAHRSYVLTTNGYITDDYGPVYRAVINFKPDWTSTTSTSTTSTRTISTRPAARC